MHAGCVLYCTDGMCYVCSGDVCYHMYWRGEQLVAVIACSGSDATSCVSVCVCGREHQREQHVVVVRCVSWWDAMPCAVPWCCVCCGQRHGVQ